MKTEVRNEGTKLQAALSGKNAYDSRSIENIFEECRHSEEKMNDLSLGDGLVPGDLCSGSVPHVFQFGHYLTGTMDIKCC